MPTRRHFLYRQALQLLRVDGVMAQMGPGLAWPLLHFHDRSINLD